MEKTKKKVVLIVGSGPNAPDAAAWDKSRFDAIVAINNAWRVRPDWDYLIHPEDFPQDRQPDVIGADQTVVTAADYVALQNTLGGFVYAGGTMAFTAGYWALAALRPDVLAFIGCDMVYPVVGNTHFYGTGTADPLRPDVTLRNLEAKSARLSLIAAGMGCACVNLSTGPSRLVFPRARPDRLAAVSPAPVGPVDAAQAREAELGYLVASGRYWEVADSFDADALAALDDLWLAAFRGGIGLDERKIS